MNGRMSRGRGRAEGELGTGGVTRGFTLLELLIVVGILSVLVAVLVPALRGARKSAKKAVCGTHLHQMGIATNGVARSNVFEHIGSPWAGLTGQVGELRSDRVVEDVHPTRVRHARGVRAVVA